MRIASFCNYLNHHQVAVADELYALLGEDFCFVATMPRSEKNLKGGTDFSSRPYCILAGESEDSHRKALEIARDAEVCIFGACSQEYAVVRAKNNPQGLSFEVGERWLKQGWLNILSPVLRKWWWNYMRYYRKANFYKLCSSAFAAEDDEKLGAYKGRHFKWGYFTEVPEASPLPSPEGEGEGKPTSNSSLKGRESIIKLLWVARFIDWKHPEMAIQLASKLKGSGLKFQVEMIGDGELRPKMEELAKSLGLKDSISFLGNIPNEEVHRHMRNSDIFLFTSDKQEGWGAVANEAMSEGCCIVGSDEIGAIPYLLGACQLNEHRLHGYNGYLDKNNKNTLEESETNVSNDGLSEVACENDSQTTSPTPSSFGNEDSSKEKTVASLQEQTLDTRHSTLETQHLKLETKKANGLMFKSRDVNDLFEKVVWAIEHPEERKQMALEGQKIIREIWSPANAAKSFMQLINDIQNGKETSIAEGPCSKA